MGKITAVHLKRSHSFANCRLEYFQNIEPLMSSFSYYNISFSLNCDAGTFRVQLILVTMFLVRD